MNRPNISSDWKKKEEKEREGATIFGMMSEKRWKEPIKSRFIPAHYLPCRSLLREAPVEIELDERSGELGFAKLGDKTCRKSIKSGEKPENHLGSTAFFPFYFSSLVNSPFVNDLGVVWEGYKLQLVRVVWNGRKGGKRGALLHVAPAQTSHP